MKRPPSNPICIHSDDIPIRIHQLVLHYILSTGSEFCSLGSLEIDPTPQKEPSHPHVCALGVDHGVSGGGEDSQYAVPGRAGTQSD